MSAAPRVKIPDKAAKDEIVDVRTFITHAMESGLRKDQAGQSIARRIINRFEASFDGRPVFSATIEPAVAANPFIRFAMRATASGDLICTWHEEGGNSWTAMAHLEVT